MPNGDKSPEGGVLVGQEHGGIGVSKESWQREQQNLGQISGKQAEFIKGIKEDIARRQIRAEIPRTEEDTSPTTTPYQETKIEEPARSEEDTQEVEQVTRPVKPVLNSLQEVPNPPSVLVRLKKQSE
jgi:hypothetical protein